MFLWGLQSVDCQAVVYQYGTVFITSRVVQILLKLQIEGETYVSIVIFMSQLVP